MTRPAPMICHGSIISPKNPYAITPAMTGSKVAVMLARAERIRLIPSL